MKQLVSILALFGFVTPLFLISACGSNAMPVAVHLADTSTLPAAMQNAPARVREAYQFAAANPDAAKNVPCYCGCGALGHRNIYDCYIKDASASGKIIFDEHALGCDICVDITQDVMRMTREGRSPTQIRRAIMDAYTQFGSPTLNEGDEK